jgi:hypothetical protein
MNLSPFRDIVKCFDDGISAVEFGTLRKSRGHVESGCVPCDSDHEFG